MVVTAAAGAVASVTLGACVPATTGATTAPPAPTKSRPAGADACVASWRPHTLRGLPLIDTATKRVAPHVVGEKITWRQGRRQIVAWVGINALDIYEDLDFVPLGRKPVGDRSWRTKAVPDLVVAEGRGTDPCANVYVSTHALGTGVAHSVVGELHVRHVPPS
jgi:hypothetical protein